MVRGEICGGEGLHGGGASSMAGFEPRGDRGTIVRHSCAEAYRRFHQV